MKNPCSCVARTKIAALMVPVVRGTLRPPSFCILKRTSTRAPSSTTLPLAAIVALSSSCCLMACSMSSMLFLCIACDRRAVPLSTFTNHADDGNRSLRLNPEVSLLSSSIVSRNSSRLPNLSPMRARTVESAIAAAMRSLRFAGSPGGVAATAATRRATSSSRTRRKDWTRRALSSSRTLILRSCRQWSP